MEEPNFENELMDVIMENIRFSPLPEEEKYTKAQENIFQILVDSAVQICESGDDDAKNSETELDGNEKTEVSKKHEDDAEKTVEKETEKENKKPVKKSKINKGMY